MSLIEGRSTQTVAGVQRTTAAWLSHVDSEGKKRLEQNTRVLQKDMVIVLEGEEVPSVFLVKSGWLAASKSLPNGERLIMDVILPGEIHDPVSANGHSSFVTLAALNEAEVFVVGATIWARLLDDQPDLRHFLERSSVAARSRQSERTLRLGKSSAETRIAYILIEMCMRMSAIGAVNEDGSFHIPLGQQQLSELAGLSSVHVCRTLRRLNRQGVITTGDHMDIEIHDIAVLAEIAGVDLDRLRGAIIPGAA